MQGYCAPHHKLFRPHVAHSSVLNPPGRTCGDPEQGSKDHNQLTSKSRIDPHQSRDWGPPLEGAPSTVCADVLRQRSQTNEFQSPHSHPQLKSSQGHLPRPHSIAPSEDCIMRNNDHNAPLVIFGGVLEEGIYTL